jgi:hypothetical protein
MNYTARAREAREGRASSGRERERARRPIYRGGEGRGEGTGESEETAAMNSIDGHQRSLNGGREEETEALISNNVGRNGRGASGHVLGVFSPARGASASAVGVAAPAGGSCHALGLGRARRGPAWGRGAAGRLRVGLGASGRDSVLGVGARRIELGLGLVEAGARRPVWPGAGRARCLGGGAVGEEGQGGPACK